MLDKFRPLEPAIPEHLRVPRICPLGMPESFVPVTKSFSARFKPTVTTLPMAFFGIQYKEESERAARALSNLARGFAGPNGPRFWDRARYVDVLGYTNAVFVGYWDAKVTYEAWQVVLPDGWWREGGELGGELGYFRECYTPGIEDTETTFSHQHPEGYSSIAESMSGEVREHGYWGSARDRLPRSQTEALEPSGKVRVRACTEVVGKGRHIVLEPQENLCLLRSGQDWRDADDVERSMYLERIAPILRSGMEFLERDGTSIGCIFNRFMSEVADDGHPLDKTYSLSAWCSLASLEKWAKAKEHLAIFGAGTNHYNVLGDDAKLRLYHEMSVVRARDQAFEYFNCHTQTGMLNSLGAEELQANSHS